MKGGKGKGLLGEKDYKKNMVNKYGEDYEYAIHEHLRVGSHRSMHELRMEEQAERKAKGRRGRGVESKRIGKLAKKNSLDHNTIEDVLKNLQRASKQARNRATVVYKRAFKRNPDEDIRTVLQNLKKLSQKDTAFRSKVKSYPKKSKRRVRFS